MTLRLDVNKYLVASIAFGALEAEANGTLGCDDARHSIKLANLVMNVVHGQTIAADLLGEAQPRLRPPQTNGHAPNSQRRQRDPTPEWRPHF